MEFIKLGSKGEAVKQWQKLLGFSGADIDGDFGPKTDKATRDFQAKHKLVVDGKVGDATWGVALGKTNIIAPAAKTPQASVDIEAYNIAKRAAPDMPEKHRQYVLTVARGEGFYGRGWGNNPTTIKKSQEMGITGKEGIGSNNWGAVQGTGSAGSFPHVDYGWKTDPATGQKVWKAYIGKYKRYATPEEGFLDMAKIILGGGKRGAEGSAEIKAALDASDLRKAVFTQHKNGYFELDPEKYLSAVTKNYGILSTNIEWKKLLTETGSFLGKAFAFIGIGAAIVVGAALLIKRG